MKFEIYQEKGCGFFYKGLWKWRLIAPNAKMVAESAKGFKTKAECKDAIFIVMLTDYKTPVVELD